MDSAIKVLEPLPRFHFDNLFWDNPRPYEEILLYQIGDLSCGNGQEIGDHRQECYEISYIVSGKGYYSTNHKKYEVEKGDIYLSLPGEIHNIIADRIDPFRYFYIGFNFAKNYGRLDFFRHIRKMFDNNSHPVMQDRHGLSEFFIGIFTELINNEEHSYRMIKTYINQIIIMTYRNYFNKWEEQYEPEKDVCPITYQIINYIDMNLCDMRALTEVGEQLGYSYSYLSNIFSRETGYTISEYFNQQRFKKAADLLRTSNLTVTQIAEKLNYQSIHAFSRAFKDNIGVSPLQYQRLYRKTIEN